jgi:hypothetical protein
MNYNEKIVEYAMEKFAGDQEACEAFIDGFMKEASANDVLKSFLNAHTSAGTTQGNVRPPETMGHTIARGVGNSMGQGLGSLAVGLGATAAGSMFNVAKNMALHSKFLQALEQAYKTNRILAQEDREKVLRYAETIFKFAPNIATDANILSSVLANAIHGEGIYPDTIKMLTDIEARYSGNTTFNPKSYT